MTVLLGATAALGAATVGATASGERASTGRDGRGHAVAVLRDADGDRIGRVVFDRWGGRVRVAVGARALPPGFHGFHVHAVGRCEGPSFASAGPHWTLRGQAHPEHTGDLPVLFVRSGGHARLETRTDRFRLRQLFDADGSAVIVHANPDNFANVPERYRPGGPDAETLAAGDSGPRIACGVVRRSARR
jgi:Cu-Zn family superoxide dismutase